MIPSEESRRVRTPVMVLFRESVMMKPSSFLLVVVVIVGKN